jgi:hypothetical protein
MPTDTLPRAATAGHCWHHTAGRRAALHTTRAFPYITAQESGPGGTIDPPKQPGRMGISHDSRVGGTHVRRFSLRPISRSAALLVDTITTSTRAMSPSAGSRPDGAVAIWPHI